MLFLPHIRVSAAQDKMNMFDRERIQVSRLSEKDYFIPALLEEFKGEGTEYYMYPQGGKIHIYDHLLPDATIPPVIKYVAPYQNRTKLRLSFPASLVMYIGCTGKDYVTTRQISDGHFTVEPATPYEIEVYARKQKTYAFCELTTSNRVKIPNIYLYALEIKDGDKIKVTINLNDKYCIKIERYDPIKDKALRSLKENINDYGSKTFFSQEGTYVSEYKYAFKVPAYFVRGYAESGDNKHAIKPGSILNIDVLKDKYGKVRAITIEPPVTCCAVCGKPIPCTYEHPITAELDKSYAETLPAVKHSIQKHDGDYDTAVKEALERLKKLSK